MGTFDNNVRATSGGLEALQVGYRGSGGYMAGWANLNAASTHNTNSGMRNLLGIEELPYAVPDPTVKPVLGNNTVVDEFTFGATDVIKALMLSGINDDTFNDAVEGMTKKTFGALDFHGRGDTVANPSAFMLLAASHAHNQDSGSGAAGFRNEMFLNTRIKPLGPETLKHQEVNKSRHQVRFNNSTVGFWGKLFADEFGVTYRQSVYWYAPYIYTADVYIGDGSTVAIPLTYAPVDVANTKAWNIATGAALTVSSVSPSGKTATVSAAPADQAVIQVIYGVLSL